MCRIIFYLFLFVISYNFRSVNVSAQNKKRSQAKTEAQKKKREALIAQAHQNYIDVAQNYLLKARHTLEMLKKKGFLGMRDIVIIETIDHFIKHAIRQIDQIRRRVILGEVIPHDEKVFSLFQPHTEWISKGKAGVPVELGLRVCVLEDQHQFILHHKVMERQTDDQVAISIVSETKQRFPDLYSCSFDKAFHSQENQKMLSGQLKVVALPRKGRLSKQAHEIQQSEAFLKAREKHSAVESAIHALEVHGLDMCCDHGIEGFKRYVALAMVSRNIQRLGAILKKQEQKMEERKMKKYFSCNGAFKIAV